MNTTYITCEYAIQNPEGLFYRGSAYGDSRDWTDSKWDIFTYTEAGAYKKLSLFPAMFGDCVVIRLS
jgi:hypothetical protein